MNNSSQSNLGQIVQSRQNSITNVSARVRKESIYDSDISFSAHSFDLLYPSISSLAMMEKFSKFHGKELTNQSIECHRRVQLIIEPVLFIEFSLLGNLVALSELLSLNCKKYGHTSFSANYFNIKKALQNLLEGRGGGLNERGVFFKPLYSDCQHLTQIYRI